MQRLPRRRLLQTLGAAGLAPTAVQAQTPCDSLQPVADFYATGLSPDRLRVLQPVLERRNVRLQALRDFAVPDSVAPIKGPLPR